MIRHYVLAAGLTLAATTIAFGETPEERQACMDDAFKFCDRFIPDQDRVFACLVQNNRMISPTCRGALAAYIPADPPPAAPKQAKGKSKDVAKNKGTATSKGPINLNPNVR